MKIYLSLILLGFLLPWSKTIGQGNPENLSCFDCHDDLLSNQVVHSPAGESCDYCHTPSGSEHPSDNLKGFVLSEDLPELCYICHEEYNTNNLHAPVEEGECMICHSPHSSPNKFLLVFQTEKLCFECHEPEMMEKRIIHQPVKLGNCQACHDPHQSEERSLLKAGSPVLCLGCHEKISQQLTKKYIHPPFEDDCMICHSPHSSNECNLTDLPHNELCFECHDDIKESMETSPVVHKVINEDRGCILCHSAHASPWQKYLANEPTELCLSCHNKAITTAKRKLSNIRQKLDKDNVVHGAIELDGCAGCHTSHFSEYPSLLTDAYPEGIYVNGKPESFALCFSCHDSEMIELQASTSITNFRNGDQNLHVLHIRGNKGRSCSTCHDMHGSSFNHLMNDKVIFGDWEMPMIYKSWNNGGSCLTGCHAEKKYDHNDAVNNEIINESTKQHKIEKYVTKEIVSAGDSTETQKLVASTNNLKFQLLKEEFNNLQIPPIYFSLRNTTMIDGSENVIRMIINFMNDKPECKIILEGHADESSEIIYDYALSKKRADRVKSVIISFGIQSDRIETAGFGIQKPVTTESNKKSSELNRRVEVKLLEN